ncbi:MAG: hypothetical protein ABIL14_06535, partial [candidate division WOR-3 bacterium]
MTRWFDPEGKEPQTFEEWISEHPYSDHYEVKFIEKLENECEKGCGTMAIITEGNIYPAIQNEVGELVLRLWLEGYTVLSYRWWGGMPEDFRNFLWSLYNVYLIKGALLIGDLPIAWFQRGTGESWPIDLFYMELDGTWLDRNGDMRYDTLYGNVEPEIYIGRLMPPILTPDYASASLKIYLQKDFLYRDSLICQPPSALVYVDDDWVNYPGLWGPVALLYSDTLLVIDPEITRASDYRQRLNIPRAWVSVFAHSSSGGHIFWFFNHTQRDDFYGIEYTTLNPPVNFYNFFACQFCKYTVPRYGGGRAVFNQNYCVGAVGSTKTGSMIYSSQFYQPLSQGKTMGEAFLTWFKEIAQGGFTPIEIDWFFGMTLLGDPFLKPKGHVRIFRSQSSLTAYNNQQKVLQESQRIHLTYEAETDGPKIIYQYSSNYGECWNPQEIIGEGFSPTIALDNQGRPHIVFRDNWNWVGTDEGHGYYQMKFYHSYKSGGSWTTREIIRVIGNPHQRPNQHYSPPSVPSFSFAIGPSDSFYFALLIKSDSVITSIYPPPGIYRIDPSGRPFKLGDLANNNLRGRVSTIREGNRVLILAAGEYINDNPCSMCDYVKIYLKRPDSPNFETLPVPQTEWYWGSNISAFAQDGKLYLCITEPNAGVWLVKCDRSITGYNFPDTSEMIFEVSGEYNPKFLKYGLLDVMVTDFNRGNTLLYFYRTGNNRWQMRQTSLPNSASFPYGIITLPSGSSQPIRPYYLILRMYHSLERNNTYFLSFVDRQLPYPSYVYCDKVTFPNQGELLTIEPGNGNLHMVYDAGGSIIYAKSLDKGETWEKVLEVDSGSYPSLCLDNSGMPRISYLKNDTIFCKTLLSDNTWHTTVIF